MLCVLKSKEKCDGSPELQGPTVDTTIPVPITVKKTAPQKVHTSTTNSPRTKKLLTF